MTAVMIGDAPTATGVSHASPGAVAFWFNGKGEGAGDGVWGRAPRDAISVGGATI